MNNTKLHNFIFSNSLFYRLHRHITFWVTRLVCLAFSQTFYSYQTGDTLAKTGHNFLRLLITKPVFLSMEIFYCYLAIYYLAPKFLYQKKYWHFGMALLILTSAIVSLDICISYFFLGTFANTPDRLLILSLDKARVNLMFGPPAVAVIFLAIKMFKTWFLKQQEKQMLITANAEAEIQLLKAQVHPHFLFNTLNNIYSFALKKSEKAAELVLQLEAMLTYMVNDCDAALVSLDKELQLMKDYMALEKVRYGNRLHTELIINGDYQAKLIAPLLMIPFVENAFKHGASKMLENPWIKAKIDIESNTLYMHLSNNKTPMTQKTAGKNGIGLKNVEKRLKLLYPSNAVLSIESKEDVFLVKMQVPLEKAGTALSN